VAVARLAAPGGVGEGVVAALAVVLGELGPGAALGVPGELLEALAEGHRLAHGPGPHAVAGRPVGTLGVELPVARQGAGGVVELEEKTWVAGGDQAVVHGPALRAQVAGEADLAAPGRFAQVLHAGAHGLRVRPPLLEVTVAPAARRAVAALAGDAVFYVKAVAELRRHVKGVAAQAELHLGRFLARLEGFGHRLELGAREPLVGAAVGVEHPRGVFVLQHRGLGERLDGAVAEAVGAARDADVDARTHLAQRLVVDLGVHRRNGGQHPQDDKKVLSSHGASPFSSPGSSLTR